MRLPFRRLSLSEFNARFERAELEKTALLSTVLPIWQFPHFYGVGRDADEDYTNKDQSFMVVSKKSGQKSTTISRELRNLSWLDSKQEPEFDPIIPIGVSTPKRFYIDSFDDHGWFTEKQWALLAPLLPPMPLEKSRGRPPASSHAIISAIFWKTANRLPWDSLHPQGPFPPKRTCRRYYKRWLLSGRLLTIYKIILKDLLQRGRVHPFEFVGEGYFKITEDHYIFAIPGVCPDTWQTRAALFFMQETYAIIRRLRREEKDAYFPHPLLVDELFDQYISCSYSLGPLESIQVHSTIPAIPKHH